MSRARSSRPIGISLKHGRQTNVRAPLADVRSVRSHLVVPIVIASCANLARPAALPVTAGRQTHPSHRVPFATDCHERWNTAPRLDTIGNGRERLTKDSNGLQRCAAIDFGLEGRCSIQLSYGRSCSASASLAVPALLFSVLVANRPLPYRRGFCHRFATRGIEPLHRLSQSCDLRAQVRVGLTDVRVERGRGHISAPLLPASNRVTILRLIFLSESLFATGLVTARCERTP